MRKIALFLATAAACAVGAFSADRAEAGALNGAKAIRAAFDDVRIVETVNGVSRLPPRKVAPYRRAAPRRRATTHVSWICAAARKQARSYRYDDRQHSYAYSRSFYGPTYGWGWRATGRSWGW
jgi:hypothetical protein